MDKIKKRAVIAGAGPAGLTAAYELVKNTDIHPVIFETTDEIGGISKTVCYNGNRMDIGGHRFFSKSDTVMNWWTDMMHVQGKPSLDDILLDRKDKEFAEGGPDPQTTDRVMLIRDRVSRIFYLRNFFDYPISLKLSTFTGMGIFRTVNAGVGYLKSTMVKLPETSLENFYINRFGKPLYKMFFEDYTEKVWGVHPSKLGADWGSQRVKGLSVFALLKDMLVKQFSSDKGTDQKNVETSLIERFIYPKLGPGQLWETVATEVKTMGGEVEMESDVVKVVIEGKKVKEVHVRRNGEIVVEPCDYFFSSMPIKDLVAAIESEDLPKDVKEIASTLPYRDFITVGILVDKMKIHNHTKIKTYKNRVPDTWIYIQEGDVKIGRLQVFNNWSPYLVKDYENTIWLGLEYFCTEGDEMWNTDPEEFKKMAAVELEKIGIIDAADVLDSVCVKVKKAYPAYYGSYYQLETVIKYLDTIENLYCIGRNGQHRYNNMDHSMLTAMEAVNNVVNGVVTKENIWAVNTEEEYHEVNSAKKEN